MITPRRHSPKEHAPVSRPASHDERHLPRAGDGERSPRAAGACGESGSACEARSSSDSRAAAEAVALAARTAFGRVVSFVATRTSDLAAAEDAVAEALVEALRSWPRQGIPDDPTAWLAVTAQRRLIDGYRRRQREERLLGELIEAAHTTRLTGASQHPMRGTSPGVASLPSRAGDDRLAVLLACTHPAIATAMHVPLMLQCVLGLTARQIAGVLLVSPTGLTRGLSRTKEKIRAAGISLAVPDLDTLAARLPAVHEAIVATFTVGWELTGDDAIVSGALAGEAIALAEAVVAQCPRDAESLGLLALLQFSHARRAARRDAEGRFVPLIDQSPHLWDRELIARAEDHLRRAAAQTRPGRLQTLAAIQSVHCDRLRTGVTNWAAIVRFYDYAVATDRSVGTLVARAAALHAAGQSEAALAQLDAVPAADVQTYQPYWVTRVRTLEALAHPAAEAARSQAIGLTSDPAVRATLIAHDTAGDDE